MQNDCLIPLCAVTGRQCQIYSSLHGQELHIRSRNPRLQGQLHKLWPVLLHGLDWGGVQRPLQGLAGTTLFPGIAAGSYSNDCCVSNVACGMFPTSFDRLDLQKIASL